MGDGLVDAQGQFGREIGIRRAHAAIVAEGLRGFESNDG
jgi:hypothetical protein